jgi:hypothetical protein
MRNRSRVVTFVIALLAIVVLVSCTPTAPEPPAPPTTVVNINVPGNGNVITPGNGNVINPAPSGSPSPGGDNAVDSFAVFCYGFGAVPPQPEPNHNLCALPPGYPNIAVTASPKNKAGQDIPNPGDKTSVDVVDWNFSVSPANAATLAIQGDNRFNARVEPASPRVAANFTLVAIYHDPQKNTWIATKSGSIQ